jgi:hypothetical protein
MTDNNDNDNGDHTDVSYTQKLAQCHLNKTNHYSN